VSAINLTAQAIFERLVLVPGPQRVVPLVTMPYAPTTPQPMSHLILDFHVFFGWDVHWPLQFLSYMEPVVVEPVVIWLISRILLNNRHGKPWAQGNKLNQYKESGNW